MSDQKGDRVPFHLHSIVEVSHPHHHIGLLHESGIGSQMLLLLLLLIYAEAGIVDNEAVIGAAGEHSSRQPHYRHVLRKHCLGNSVVLRIALPYIAFVGCTA